MGATRPDPNESRYTPDPDDSKPVIRKRWQVPVTEERKAIFLDEMRKHGVFAAAAAKASPHSKFGALSTWRMLIRDDPDFRAAYEEARDIARATVEREIVRRGVEGVEEPIYQKGEQVGTVTRYSDRMLELHAKRLMPEYRERAQVEHTGQVNVRVDVDLGIKRLSPENQLLFEKIIESELAREMASKLLPTGSAGHGSPVLDAEFVTSPPAELGPQGSSGAAHGVSQEEADPEGS